MTERVDDGALGDRTGDLELDLPADPGQGPQVAGENDPDHDSVWTSTETTGGRSRATAFQLSPASAEA